jgi:DNA-binding NarL/FixJ family response regulator
VSGFLTTDVSIDELATTIRAIALGAPVAVPRPAAIDAVSMTPREREVIDLIAEGLSNEEMTARLGIATATVRSHVRNVMEKLTLRTRLRIAAYAHRGDAP